MHKAWSEVGILYFGAFVSEGNALTIEYATTTNKHVIINKLQQKWGHEGIFASNFLLVNDIQYAIVAICGGKEGVFHFLIAWWKWPLQGGILLKIPLCLIGIGK